MFSGISHEAKDKNGSKTELLFSTLWWFFHVGQSKVTLPWAAWGSLKLSKKQFRLEQNPCARLPGVERPEAFPQMF